MKLDSSVDFADVQPLQAGSHQAYRHLPVNVGYRRRLDSLTDLHLPVYTVHVYPALDIGGIDSSVYLVQGKIDPGWNLQHHVSLYVIFRYALFLVDLQVGRRTIDQDFTCPIKVSLAGGSSDYLYFGFGPGRGLDFDRSVYRIYLDQRACA